MSGRRWQILIVDDIATGSAEKTWVSPFLFGTREAGFTDDTIFDLSAFGRKYAEANDCYCRSEELDFQETEQRATLRRDLWESERRFPIVDVMRSLTSGWLALGERRHHPPDILLLDVRLDSGVETSAEELEATHRLAESIVREVEARKVRRGPRAGSEAMEIQEQIGLATADLPGRGGLYLLGRAISLFSEEATRPIIVVYTASVKIRSDYLPVEYALGEKFKIVPKNHMLREDFKREVIWGRIRQFVRDGLLERTALRKAIDRFLRKPSDSEALGAEIGSGWLFWRLFVPTVEDFFFRRQREKAREDLHDFLRELTEGRVVVDFFRSDWMSLVTHSKPVLLEKGPCSDEQLLVETGVNVAEKAIEELRRLPRETVRAIDDATRPGLGGGAGVVLSEALLELAVATKILVGLKASSVGSTDEVARAKVEDSYRSLKDAINRVVWEYFRVEDVAKGVDKLLVEAAPALQRDEDSEHVANEQMIWTYLARSQARPLGSQWSLAGTVVESIVREFTSNLGKYSPRAKAQWTRRYDPERLTLDLELRSDGARWAGLERYRFPSAEERSSGLRGAVARAKGFLGVTIISGDCWRNPFSESGRILPESFEGLKVIVAIPVFEVGRES